MKVTILWIRHCESCANVVNHSKYKKRWFTDRKQGFEIPPNCTLIGLIQSYMFGYHVLPLLLKKYPQFKNIDLYCSVLKRTMITNKLIMHGLKKSKYKVKTSKEVERLCNISERPTPYERMKRIEFNNISVKKSNKQLKKVNKTYKKTGKKISKRIRKKTKQCGKTNLEKFSEEILPTFNNKSLNLIVAHGVILRRFLKIKRFNNVDAALVEHDTTTGKFKIIEEIRNKTDLSEVKNSYKRIKDGSYNLHYKSKSINHRAKITIEEFEKVLDLKLAKQLQLKKLDNEITCDK